MVATGDSVRLRHLAHARPRRARDRPGPLPAAVAAGAGARARRRQGQAGGRRRSGCRPSATCSSTCPRDRREARAVAAAGRRRARDRGRRGQEHRLAPGAAAGDAAAGRGDRRRRHRLDEGDVLQPAVAGAEVPARDAAGAARQVRGARPGSASRPTRDRRTTAAGAGAVAHYPATEGLSSTQILALVRRHAGRLADVVEPLPARLRSRRAPARPRGALAAAHFPARDTDQEQRPAPARVRRAAADAAGAAAPPPAPARARRRAGARRRARADRPLACRRCCRSR